MQPRCRIALFGECMIELRGQMFGPMQQYFGGDTLNTAVYLARLVKDSGIEVAYATQLGTDAYSQGMLQAWQQEGLDISLVARAAGRMPGLYTIQVDEHRARLWTHGQADAQQWFDRAFDGCDLALITLEDHQALYGIADAQAAIDHAQALAPSEIVIKRGAEPTLVRQADGRIFSVPIYKVDKVIDTTGAGDSFAAGYLAARLQGQTPEVAARSGSRMASIVIQHAGAIVPNAVMPIFFFA